MWYVIGNQSIKVFFFKLLHETYDSLILFFNSHSIKLYIWEEYYGESNLYEFWITFTHHFGNVNINNLNIDLYRTHLQEDEDKKQNDLITN